MHDDFELDRIVSELKKYKSNEQKGGNFADDFLANLMQAADKDMNLGDYLRTESKHDELFPRDKLFGLLDDLEDEKKMDERELDEYDLSSIDQGQQRELEKQLFVNHKNKVRQSAGKRIKSYANSNAKLSKESSMRPLSLKKYNHD